MLLKDQTLIEYSRLLAAKQPTPGGGSAAACMGALGCGLLSMVTNYTKAKKNQTEQVLETLDAFLQAFERGRCDFLELVDRDAQAYQQVVASRSLGDDEKQKANALAREIPNQMAMAADQLKAQAEQLMPYVNKWLQSDVRIAIEMLSATGRSAQVLVEVNQ